MSLIEICYVTVTDRQASLRCENRQIMRLTLGSGLAPPHLSTPAARASVATRIRTWCGALYKLLFLRLYQLYFYPPKKLLEQAVCPAL